MSSVCLAFKNFAKRYRLESEIGRGGFGCVYSATKLDTNEKVAIKEFPRSSVLSFAEGDGSSLPMEVFALRKVQGVEGVIQLLDFHTLGVTYMMVMEKPQNAIDLFDLVTRAGRLSEPTAKKLLWQIVRAVHGCVERGVHHCDLKDENVLVDLESDGVKLIDFGLANVVGQKQHWAPGTRAYSPPEWVTHRRYLPEPAAVWTIGAILHTMLYGCLPFGDESTVVACQLEKKAGVSEAAFSLLAACLAKRPSKRPTLLGILNSSWVSGLAPGLCEC